MGNVLFIHAVGLTPYALDEQLPLKRHNGEYATAFQYVMEKIQFFPQLDRVVVLTDLPKDVLARHWHPEFGEIVSRPAWSAADLLRSMQSEAGFDDENGDLFLLWADAPLLDAGLTEKMYQNHRRYFADYSFADGYPRGLAPEILRRSALRQLIELAERHSVPAGRDFIFEVIQKDINAFDLETEVAPSDQRLLRVSLTADTKRNFHQLRGIIDAGGRDAESVQRIIAEQPELLRTLPAFVNVQIIDGCPQACSYCPFPQFGGDILEKRGEMPLKRWKDLVEIVEAFCGDAVISVSLWGEPALHSQFVELAAEVLRHPSLSLVVETSGAGWSLSVLQELGRRFGRASTGTAAAADGDIPVGNRLTWIVSLDANDAEMYRQLRGEQWQEALATVETLRRIFPGQVYVQAVRMKSNEEQLDAFYRYWKQQSDVQPIVQKYDAFCGALPQRKVTDLSPINRFPCWHLKRDLTVLIDGSVPMCREDLKQQHLLGNIFEEDIAEVWERGVDYYRKHIDEEYPDLCRSCDEYYTYNF
ncbi:MAG: spiro-SPASM protein [Spirochaetota bacterium]